VEIFYEKIWALIISIFLILYADYISNIVLETDLLSVVEVQTAIDG